MGLGGFERRFFVSSWLCSGLALVGTARWPVLAAFARWSCRIGRQRGNTAVGGVFEPNVYRAMEGMANG